MRYRKMGTSDLEVSVIGHGTWPLGSDFFGDIDAKEGIKAIHQAIDLGINLIDTAPPYGEDCIAEKRVGEALQGIPRDKVIISDKCGTFRKYGEYVRCLSPTVVRGQLEESLRNLKTDFIDIYMIHWPDMNFGIDDALELLQRFKEEGKIREAAVSNFSIGEIKTAVEKAGIICVQPPLDLLGRAGIKSGVIPFCAENQIGTMVYGSLAGGILTGNIKEPLPVSGAELRGSFYQYYAEPMWSKVQKVLDVLREIASEHDADVSEVAINWALAQPGVTTALFGSTSPAHVIENAKAADWEMTPEEAARIDAAWEANIAAS